jgi:hypothetical protein
VLGAEIVAPASAPTALPKTGVERRSWVVAGDVLLIAGVALLLTATTRRRQVIGW